MDLHGYVARHAPEWDRLGELVNRPTFRASRLTGAEVDELVELYQRVSTQLTVLRSSHSDPVLEARLSTLVAQGRAVITGASTPLLTHAGRFLTEYFPAAVYRARWTWIGVGLMCVAVAVLVAWRVINTPGLGESLLDSDQVRQLVDHDFAAYYTDNPASDFALLVWVNNAKVAATALILGVLVIPTVHVLYSNMANVGVVAGYMISYGRADVFFGLLLPHGLLELTCVFVAAGAGLRLGWAWIAPGPRSRARALAEEGRAAGAVALGLALVLLVSGLVEGFVTGSRLPVGARLGIGVVVWVGFLTYVFTLGRRAARAGRTGDLEDSDRSAEVPAEAG